MTTGSKIRSGEFGDPGARRDYKAEWLGEALVERVIWGEMAAPVQRLGVVVADEAYVWYRFWLPRHGQVVERYYAPDGRPAGTKIDVCASLVCDESGCQADDLILDIWIGPDGMVNIYNEQEFEEATGAGRLSPDEAEQAERRVRELTGAIARGKAPPAIVRNWQVAPRRLDESAHPPLNGPAHERDTD